MRTENGRGLGLRFYDLIFLRVGRSHFHMENGAGTAGQFEIGEWEVLQEQTERMEREGDEVGEVSRAKPPRR